MSLEICPGFVVLVPPGPAFCWVLACLGHHSVCNADELHLQDWLGGCGCKFRTLVEPLNEPLERLLGVLRRLESFVVYRHIRQGDASAVLVEVFEEIHGGPRCVSGALVFQSCQVWVVKDRKHLVLQVRVDCPVLVM